MHQFSCSFLFKYPKISPRVHILTLEHPLMKFKGCATRTTASYTVCMNTGRVVGESRPIKTRNNPILKLKISVF